MTREMDKQTRRAGRILRNFGRYVEEAAGLDVPTIARTKPRTYARIKRNVAWRLMAKAMRDHGDATGWQKPDDVKNAAQARQSFARYIEADIIASGKTEATPEELMTR